MGGSAGVIFHFLIFLMLEIFQAYHFLGFSIVKIHFFQKIAQKTTLNISLLGRGCYFV